jgi:hypothetical protein
MACAVVLVLVTVAAAQQKPEPVIRIGDWVEIGNEAFMNIIAGGDMRYNTAHNMDFEDKVRDRTPDRDPFSTVNINQQTDAFFVQARWGADFRYQKNLLFQVLFQWEGALDGNLIDDRHNDPNPGGDDVFGRDPVNEDESTNLERLWLEYKFEGTPVRIRVGSDLWYSDQAGMVGDDDPRFALFLDLPGDLEIGAWAVLQTTNLRLGLTNDHSFWYYVFHASYKGAKPMVLALDMVYFRDRSSLTPAVAAGAAFQGQQTDSFLIMPSFSGTFGPITALLQPMILLGQADSCNSFFNGCATPGGDEYDIFAWGGVAYLEANLGIVRPFLGFIIGSGDDDPDDSDLNGFTTLPQREITLMTGTSFFGHLDTTTSFGTRDVVTPALNGAVGGGGALFGGQEFGHTVGNPFNDRIGNFMHPGLNITYSNPGTLLIPAGLKISPAIGHEVALAFIYRAMLQSDMVEDALGTNVAKTLYYEAWLQWQWTLNRHFDIRLNGSVLIPGSGAKDIAETSTAEPTGIGSGCGGLAQNCKGDDLGFHAQARFRAQF